MSSPETSPTRSFRGSPSRRATASTASAQPRGLTPPAFEVTRTPRSTMSGRIRSMSGTKSRAYPADGSRDFCFCMMDIVTSAR